MQTEVRYSRADMEKLVGRFGAEGATRLIGEGVSMADVEAADRFERPAKGSLAALQSAVHVRGDIKQRAALARRQDVAREHRMASRRGRFDTAAEMRKLAAKGCCTPR